MVIVESYKSSSMSGKEESFAERKSRQVHGYDQISQCLKAEFLKSPTLFATFGWRQPLCRNYFSAYCDASERHRSLSSYGCAGLVSVLQQSCVP